MKYAELKRKYPKFIYENYSYKISGRNLEIFFIFSVGNIFFKPKIVVENIDLKSLKRIGDGALDNLAFNLGLMELLSYWKAACSPLIEVKAGYLNKEQIKWWKNLIIKGMGQFYYENKIDWRKKNFLKIVSVGDKRLKPHLNILKNRYLVPFAGGRDSIVTLESLKRKKLDITLFTVNPIEKIQKTMKVSGIKKQIIIRRTIDRRLLDLNRRGYLNGHTPFTGILSFISVLCAVMFNYKNIAFSNEKSSDEGNVKYLGRMVNHQWAKSSEFEKMFKNYCKKHLARNINYFSYIRDYGELEISKKLSGYKKYFPVFSSCNAGMKINTKGILQAKERWCGNCPKCLFVYMTLYPFLTKKELLKIFNKDIFENKRLLPIMNGLLGKNTIKPFECVGTKEESQKAFILCFKKAKKEGKIPYLLTKAKLSDII